jgi:NHLM bacteriocin system ABC transporter ATP-binding protein
VNGNISDTAYLAAKIRSMDVLAFGGKVMPPPGGDPLHYALSVIAVELDLPLRKGTLHVPGDAQAQRGRSEHPAENGTFPCADAPKRRLDAAPETGISDQAAEARRRVAARLHRIAADNHWRIRKVSPGGDFTGHASGALIGFMGENACPVVLRLRGKDSSWLNPDTGKEVILSEKDRGFFHPCAYQVYALFPSGPLDRSSVFRFACGKARPVLSAVFCVGLLSGLIGLLQPAAVEYVTGKILNTANLVELRQFFIVLAAAAFSSALLRTAGNVNLLGFSISRTERFEAAVFDRLFRIRIPFFSTYSAGDLCSRVTALSALQEQALAVITRQISASLFSLLSLVMIFYYDWKPALVGLGLTCVYCILLLVLLRASLPVLTRQAEAEGNMAGMLKQFFDGIAKIRGAGAEKRITARYLDDFIPAVRASYDILKYEIRLALLGILFPVVITVTFFWLVGDIWRAGMDMPRFLAFLTAFGCFQGGVVGMCGGLWELWEMGPQLRRIDPILKAELETDAGSADPGILDGSVELSHVGFRYAPGGSPVLEDICIKAAPGEFIAVVGPSGAGKSSLVRLLLGFEKPESGSIFYSGNDSAGLDVVAVRRQLGVILQNSRVMPGTVLSTIISGTEYTIEDAQKALRIAGMEEETAAMPLGLFTPVGDGLISGGQAQRLLIARAVVGNPAVLILDEATSALDNITQEQVRKNIEELRVTRIVIAHRLSTIEKADRIYVLDKGRIVQVGTFEELSAQDGIFRESARRQSL